jgi:outer membrane biosynthesis protein TonB
MLALIFLAATFSSVSFDEAQGKGSKTMVCGNSDSIHFSWNDSSYNTLNDSINPTQSELPGIDTGKYANRPISLKADTAASRSPNSVFYAIKKHANSFSKIYGKYQGLDNSIGGKIMMTFKISPSGKVISILEISSTTNCPSLDKEILQEAKYLEFEKIPKGIVTATYTFNLKNK